ncbi:glutathione S-transferase family protein [Azospirillum sp.]|uniref:glutathione S-transferase family protein n=1 Tax=Azospirillum sp. TaxID=34012 RepID=UPI003D739E31
MTTLYLIPSSAAMAPHILLREIGAPFELVVLDRERGEHRTAEYLKLNPNGRVPTLVDGDLVIFESAAICLHLADTHRHARLAPPVGTPERARFTQWLVYLTNTVQADMMLYFYPERFAPAAVAEQVKAMAVDRLMGQFGLLDGELEGREFLVGTHFTAVDAYLFMVARWTRHMPRKARDLPHLGPYLARIQARPSVQAVYRAEGCEAFY